MDITKDIQSSRLESIVEKFTKETTEPINNLVKSMYEGSIKTYLKSKMKEFEDQTSKLSNNTKQNLYSYLDYLINSGKVYEYGMGIALENTGYTPRTIGDIISPKASNQEEREKREVARYVIKVIFNMLPKEIHSILMEKTINEVRKSILESLRKEVVYLKTYLSNKNVNEQEIEPSIHTTLITLNLLPELASNQYLTLYRIFRPEILNVLTENMIQSSKDTYKELHNLILDLLKVKEEPKKENKDINANVKVEEEKLNNDKSDSSEVKEEPKKENNKQDIEIKVEEEY